MYRTNMNGMRRRVTRRRVAASSSGMGLLTEVLHLAVTKAGDEVVVHHAHRLHERIADGRPDEAEAALRQRVAHRVGLPRARREVAEGATAIVFGRPAHEAPEKHAERPVPCLELEERARVRYRRMHLLAVAHDAGVLEQLRDLLAIVAGHALRVEPVERLEEAGALVQDDAPREPGLEAIEHELREQVPVAPQGHAPLLVVIGEHQRVVATGPAALDHGAATASVTRDG